jgi:hypothetical protein
MTVDLFHCAATLPRSVVISTKTCFSNSSHGALSKYSKQMGHNFMLYFSYNCHTILIFSLDTKEKDKESKGCHHTQNLNTKSRSRSNNVNGPVSNIGAKSSIAQSMAVP